MKLILTIAACFVASVIVEVDGKAVHTGFLSRQPFKIGFDNAVHNAFQTSSSSSLTDVKKDFVGAVDIRGGGGKVAVAKPPAILKWAYSAAGLAVTAAYATIVLTTIRSNQPLGAMMPNWQHPLVNQISVLSAIPLFVSSFLSLRKASCSDSWDELSSTSCRRQNLALAAAGVGSCLWINFAATITAVPGSSPAASHAVYNGVMKAALIGAYGSAAALTGAVWRRSLPEDVRNDPLSWPGRVADGVAKSIVSIAPGSVNDPVNVKYALLTSGFLVLTAIGTLGPHPLAVIPSWTGRRISRLFPVWTALAAVTAFDLKESTENGVLATRRTLSNGIKGMGAIHLASKAGAIFLDPTFPGSYHAVVMVPGWAAAAIAFFTLTLRPDE